MLKSLPRESTKNYLQTGKFSIVSYGKNSIIHFADERCHDLEIILSGKVIVERIDEAGNLLTVAEFYEDDIVGGNLIFSQNPYYPMTVTARLPTTILKVDKETLFKLFCQNPPLLRTYLEIVADHALILGDKIKHYVNKTIRESIISFLKYESKKQNSRHIELNITKKALAEKMGVQRTSLSRELAKMRNEGLISYDARSIKILKPDL
ncbi:MAG TPA: Crp/Fnr family transcriptional regulator [Firmicutes bacterium]|nr:Crp/Fnr family transcriptional regulator [Bacillota bacterium]